MALIGNLRTMPLPDLLQWLASAAKSGTLRIERDKHVKWIRLRDGRVVGCSSDAPPQRLGQYLLARERINEQQLREALSSQEESSHPLGEILVTMGLISDDDLLEHLEGQAEETIYSLFDWTDGVFRYEEEELPADGTYPFDLRVEDVLLRGLKRFDEMKRIRDVFPTPSVVLRYTSKPPAPEIFADPASRAMYAAIDGERSLAEIVLHVHGSEYMVFKFLYELTKDGYASVAGMKQEPATKPLSSMDSGPPAQEIDLPPLDAELADFDIDVPATRSACEPAAVTVARPAVAAPAVDADVEEQLGRARELIEQGQIVSALGVLDALYRRHPEDDSLRRLTAEAEAQFVDHAYRHIVPADRIPFMRRSMDDLAGEELSPHDFFILSRIDGNWDVKSIVQIAPMREVEALQTLCRMRESGTIELRAPREDD